MSLHCRLAYSNSWNAELALNSVCKFWLAHLHMWIKWKLFFWLLSKTFKIHLKRKEKLVTRSHFWGLHKKNRIFFSILFLHYSLCPAFQLLLKFSSARRIFKINSRTGAISVCYRLQLFLTCVCSWCIHVHWRNTWHNCVYDCGNVIFRAFQHKVESAVGFGLSVHLFASMGKVGQGHKHTHLTTGQSYFGANGHSPPCLVYLCALCIFFKPGHMADIIATRWIGGLLLMTDYVQLLFLYSVRAALRVSPNRKRLWRPF